MRGKYFIDDLNSFLLGSPDLVYAWKRTIQEIENDGYDVVAFRLPKKQKQELLEEIERLIYLKMKP